MATAVVALVATSMAMPVWTLAYSDTLGLLGVVVALALLATRRYAVARCRPYCARGDSSGDGSPGRCRGLGQRVHLAAVDDTYPRGCPGDDDLGGRSTVLIWPVVAWVATGNPLTYWDTEKAYEHPGKPRSWFVWALEYRPRGWSSPSRSSSRSSSGPRRVHFRRTPRSRWRAWLVAYPVYLGAATFISGSLVRYLLPTLSRRSAAGRTRPVTCGADYRWPLVVLWGSPCRSAWVVIFVVPAQGLVP